MYFLAHSNLLRLFWDRKRGLETATLPLSSFEANRLLIVSILTGFSLVLLSNAWILRAIAILLPKEVYLMYRSSCWVVTLGLWDLGPVENDPVSLKLCKGHSIAALQTLALSSILCCDIPSLLNAIIWLLVPSMRFLDISIQDMERRSPYFISSLIKQKK